MVNWIGFWTTLIGLLMFQLSGGHEFQPRERIIVSQAPWIVTPSQDVRMTKQRPKLVQEPGPQLSGDFALTPTNTVFVPLFPERHTAYVAGSAVNLRVGPGTEHAVIETLLEGVQAEVITTDSGWSQIHVAEIGETGWMASRFLSEG